MVAFALITMLAVALLCGILYLLLQGRRNESKKPVSRPRASLPFSEIPARCDDHWLADHAVPPFASPDESAQSLQSHLTKGMALAFSFQEPSTVNSRPLLNLEDVDGEVRQTVLSHIGSLKNFNALHKLQKMIGDPQSAMAELSRMITNDPLLTAKILRVANSSYYGMEQKLNSISHAIMIIGLVNLKGIIYNEGILNVMNEKRHDDPGILALLQHATFTTICASSLAYLFKNLNQGTLFTLGILHDIGKFLMMKLPALQDNDLAEGKGYSPDWTIEEEEKIYGINHALVGKLALQHWGLSELMVETIRFHHIPGYLSLEEAGLDDETLQYLLVLFLADQVAHLVADEINGVRIGETCIDRLHPSYHGLIDQKKLQQLLMDQSLSGQLREAEAIAGTSLQGIPRR